MTSQASTGHYMSDMRSEQTVFVVDDDPGVLDSLGLVLRSAGLRVETFSTPEEFLGSYDNSRGGCLVLDMCLPGMSGIELQHALVEFDPVLPIIFISGVADVSSAMQAVLQGAVDFVEKPFDANRLLQKVEFALERDAENRRRIRERNYDKFRFSNLTKMQKDIVEALASGKAYADIGAHFSVSSEDIEKSLEHIMRRMDACSIPQLMEKIAIARNS